MSESFFNSLESKLNQFSFPVWGVVDFDLAWPAFMEHQSRYQNWIDKSYHGSMTYLERGLERRMDPRNLMSTAKSILCVAVPYPTKRPGFESAADGPRYARYLHGKDYHIEIRDQLESLICELKMDLRSANADGLEYKVCVDTSALLERTWAYLCGLGWLGKNTLLIHPKLGSYFFIGTVLLSKKTGRTPNIKPNYCGQCTRCLSGCPTQAFVGTSELDSRKCISYLNLEDRSEWPDQTNNDNVLGPCLAGCDICQEVCPFNLKRERENRKDFGGAEAMSLGWLGLLHESAEEYALRVKNSALNRIRTKQHDRNLLHAMGGALEENIACNNRNEIEKYYIAIQNRIERNEAPDHREGWVLLARRIDQSLNAKR